MRSFIRRYALAWCLLATPVFAAPPTVQELAERLRSRDDFRVRVQAALELGKTDDPDALAPLLASLDDPNASVRAACVAALEALGDPDAVPALKARRLDKSEAVRSQIKSTLAVFAARAASAERAPTAKGPRLLVKLGAMKNQTSVKGPRIEAELERESRKKLGELPGVEVLAPASDSGKGPDKKKLPVVLVSGHIQKLKASREGGEIVYSASVEYILHTMPDQSIAAKVSGSASGTLSESEARDEARAAELRHEVLGAAISSALRRAPQALLAAARL